MKSIQESLGESVITLAGKLLEEARQGETGLERRERQSLAKLVEDETGKAFVLELADKVLRVRSRAKAAQVFRELLQKYGSPSFMGLLEKLGLQTGFWVSKWIPGLIVPFLEEGVRFQSRKVILNAAKPQVIRHSKRRNADGFRLNYNGLGESVLGEHEASERLRGVLDLLAIDEVNYVSIKISALYSQITPISIDHAFGVVCEKLRTIYRAALAHSPAKFINLDMEEYRDVRLTLDVFKAVLMEEEFLTLSAGIVLQAYLPDGFPLLQELTEWARARVKHGGAPVKVRIVKGANLAMENVDAEIHGWACAPYGSKHEVDANYKRMVEYACRAENAEFLRLGVASHNLFDVAHALILREKYQSQSWVEFEMLEGMANPESRAVLKASGHLVLYAPVVDRRSFSHAMAYLVRRLDENTAPQNFLRQSFGMELGSPQWKEQSQGFLRALDAAHQVSVGPNRKQDRSAEVRQFLDPVAIEQGFRNEADTDFILPQNREWIRREVDSWESWAPRTLLPIVHGEAVQTQDCVSVVDPGAPEKGTLYEVHRGGEAEVEKALSVAHGAFEAWDQQGFEVRKQILLRVAERIAANRGRIIATMMRDAGKAISEGDVEVSEAIDFATFYARAFEALPKQIQSRARGVVVVASPWNFPFAIPVGSVLAALMAGNSVIFKPAPETVLTAWLGAQLMWEAGVPKEVLQFLPVPENEVGKRLITDERTQVVSLVGAWQTAQLFLGWKPHLRLFAETSGKNCMVITAKADTDLAIKDLVKSAFGHAGQKCSAASLALVEAEVYDDLAFHKQLLDAASSLSVGPAHEWQHAVNTLISEPSGPLKDVLENPLAAGESWLLKPQPLRGNGRLWSPGILTGVTKESPFVHAECFGPVLGVMRVRDLAHAIEIQNSLEYGLTGGIQSLDQEEIRSWTEQVQVGNAYVNRAITGAIVNRQPFGGWKKSCVGPGAKAGGRNHLFMFRHFDSQSLPDEQPVLESAQGFLNQVKALVDSEEYLRLQRAAGDYSSNWESEFSVEHDPSGLVCEKNVFRYRRRSKILFRMQEGQETQALMSALACRIAGVDFELSCVKKNAITTFLKGKVESEEALFQRFLKGELKSVSAVRAPDTQLNESLKRFLNQENVVVLDAKVLPWGRLEMLHAYREQSISSTMHRYGNPLKSL